MKEMCLSFSKSPYHLFATNITATWGDFAYSRVFHTYLGFLRDETPPKPRTTFPCITFVHKATDASPWLPKLNYDR